MRQCSLQIVSRESRYKGGEWGEGGGELMRRQARNEPWPVSQLKDSSRTKERDKDHKVKRVTSRLIYSQDRVLLIYVDLNMKSNC